MIYEVLTAIVLMFGLFSLQKYKFNYKKVSIVIIGIAFTIFMGFRSERVGTDTLSYINGFKRSPKFSFSFMQEAFSEKEGLYHTFKSFVRLFTDNYTIYFTIIAIFFMAVVCRFIYKYSDNPTMSFICFMSMVYFCFSLAGIRQTIALGFLLLAMDSMIEKKPIRAIILVGIASLFHISSLIGVFIIIIYYLPLNFTYIAVCGVLSAFMFISGNSFWKKIVDLIWEDSRVYKEEFGGTSMLVVLILIVLGVAFIAPGIFTRKNNLQQFDTVTQNFITTNAYFYRLFLFSIPFQVLAIYQANAFRVAMIFHIVMIVLLPNAVKMLKNQQERIIITIVLIGCFLVQLFVFNYDSADINPYTFFWQV